MKGTNITKFTLIILFISLFLILNLIHFIMLNIVKSYIVLNTILEILLFTFALVYSFCIIIYSCIKINNQIIENKSLLNIKDYYILEGLILGFIVTSLFILLIQDINLGLLNLSTSLMLLYIFYEKFEK